MLSDAMLMGGGRKAAYSIENALLFRGGQYLRRDNTTASVNTAITVSLWVRRARLGAVQHVLYGYDGAHSDGFQFTADDKLRFYSDGAYDGDIYSAAAYRDVTGWYHFVVSIDTTQPAPQDRVKIYVNGAQVTMSGTFPSLGHVMGWASSAGYLAIGADVYNAAGYLDGYLAEPIVVHGTALSPTRFGEPDPVSGSWRPKAVVGISWGANGSYLGKPWNGGSLGADYSGQGNNWTPNGLAASDVVGDTPTNVYATLNRTERPHNIAGFSNGNLTVDCDATGYYGYAFSTLAVSSGKFYWEITSNRSSNDGVDPGCGGITDIASTFVNYLNGGTGPGGAGIYPGQDSLSWRYRYGLLYSNGGSVGYGSANVPGDVVMFALDMDSGKWFIGKNGTWFNSSDPASGANPAISTGLVGRTILPFVEGYYGSQNTVNFGQKPFAYTPPPGFKSLCTVNLPAPTIRQPKKHMGVATWTGNAAERSIDVGLQPDFVWLKSRTQAASHRLLDSVRGAGKVLVSNGTVAEFDENGLTAFTANGFNLLHNTEYNEPGNTYVGWCWKAGGAAVANTDGMATSQVSVNPAAGFGIVTYSGSGSPVSVGHGLGAVPAMAIFKDRSAASNWRVFHKSVFDVDGKSLFLNLGSGAADPYTVFGPGTQTISLAADATVNAAGHDYVAYCWSEIPGFSKFGSYSGNGSADGPFVHCGFRPRWVLIKCIDLEPTNWRLIDTARQDINGKTALLLPNTSDTEYTDAGNYDFDVVANGFKVRGTGGWVNGTGNHYIFAAFAEYPLGASRVTPATAR